MVTRNERRLIKQYNAERDAVLRSLSVEKLLAFLEKNDLPVPDNWEPLSLEILMHRSRLSLTTFSEEEKQVSRDWLKEHGCLMTLAEVEPN